jgi:hypothetical protein
MESWSSGKPQFVLPSGIGTFESWSSGAPIPEPQSAEEPPPPATTDRSTTLRTMSELCATSRLFA